MKNFKCKGLSFLSILFATVLPGCSGSSHKALNLGVVSYQDLVQRVTVPGSVNPLKKTIISAPNNGYVKKIYVQLGQRVKAGDPIVSVVQSLRIDEEVYPLRAPFSGIVVQLLKTEGEYVEQAGGGSGANAIARIDDLSQLFIDMTVPEIEANRLKEGQEAVIKAPAILDRKYKGKIKYLSLAAKEQKDWMDKSKVEFLAQAQVLDPDPHLKPGMSVIVDIIAFKKPHVLSLRQEYVRQEGEEHFVTLSTGEKRKIETGLQNDEVVEVRAGVKEGDQVQQTDFLSLIRDDRR